jgi:hypothetical protein
MLAIQNRQYEGAKALLELGADPNLPDAYDGSSAIIDAAGLSSANGDGIKLLELLLKYGADPNDVEIGPRREGNTRRNTPLLQASEESLKRVQLLVDAGASIIYKNEFGVTPLSSAFMQNMYDIVLFLLQHGADYNTPIVERDGKKLYLADMLRELMVPIGSNGYKAKMEIIAFLEGKGIDYKKVPVPDFVVDEAKRMCPMKWEQYLAKY